MIREILSAVSERKRRIASLKDKSPYYPSILLDRVNVNDPRGYHIDNIQVLTASENIRKRNAVDYAQPCTELGETRESPF